MIQLIFCSIRTFNLMLWHGVSHRRFIESAFTASATSSFSFLPPGQLTSHRRLTQDHLNHTLEMRDACVQLRSRCEWGLIQEGFSATEASFDSDKCLELVDAMEIIYKTQKAAPGRIGSTFVFLGPKHVAFLKGAYRDRCLCCARWSRLRTPSICPLPGGRGPTHDHSIFRVPFGCSHHCIEGYCWYS